MTDLPRHLRDSILARAREVPSPTRTRRAVYAAAAQAAIALAALALGLSARTPPSLSWFLIATLVCCVVSIGAVSQASRSSLEQSRTTRIVLAGLVPVVLVMGTVAAQRTSGLEAPLSALSSCLFSCIALGLSLLLVVGWGLRPMDPVSPWATGLALAASAGSWSALCFSLRCSSTEWFHLGVAHVGPVLVLLLFGALLGQRFFGVRRIRR